MAARNSSILYVALMLAVLLRPVSLIAAEGGGINAGADVPLEITADQSFEWYQDQKVYVARGNAQAVKGDVIINADVLTAHQRENKLEANNAVQKNKKDTGDIDRVTAEGNVHISDPRQQAFGEKAVYDLDQGVFRMTGDNLKYATDSEVITAKESMEYYESKNVAIARGRAIGVHQKTPDDRRKVEADVLTAQFAELPGGGRELAKLSADGHVTIVTKEDVSRGQHAVYDIKRNVAVMTGAVKITHGNTQLYGDKAEVDFVSGKSRLLNEGKGRVRAMLIPKSDSNRTVKPKDNSR